MGTFRLRVRLRVRARVRVRLRARVRVRVRLGLGSGLGFITLPRAVACSEKTGGWGAQSNFPTLDHQQPVMMWLFGATYSIIYKLFLFTLLNFFLSLTKNIK